MSLNTIPSHTRRLLSATASSSNHFALSSIPHHYRNQHHHHRLYSSPSQPNKNTTTNNPSQFKVLPILAIIGLGTGSYVLLVKSRVGQQSPRKQSS